MIAKLLTLLLKTCLVLFVWFGFATISFAQSDDTYPFSSPIESERFTALTQEIRCVVCQNQSLSDSNAPLALDLRGKIYNMVLDKKSDEEIKNYLVQRYGNFILLQPRFNKETLILWFFPLIALGCAFIFLRQFFAVEKIK